MTWGALNNHREKAQSEPLPDFLTGQSGKSFNDRLDPQFQNSEDAVVRKTERHNNVRKGSTRGYGVAYSGGVNIQMSKKTLLVSVVFFATVIVLTFCTGYLAGNVSVVVSTPPAISMTPLKKPIIPVRKKSKQETPKSVTVMKNEELSSKGDTHHVSSENNNKDNESEALYKTTQSAADTGELGD